MIYSSDYAMSEVIEVPLNETESVGTDNENISLLAEPM